MAESTIGKGFEPYVQSQVTTRQQIAGSGITSEYSDSVIKYNNSKTSWLRLTSGVNVGSSEALATQYVLGGGTNFADTYAGVGYNSTSAYGFRSNKNYGYVPIPGITSAQVKSLNRGSLREAKIEIKCHNLEQFKDIEKVFLKLQYSMLLEWGHSMYFDNKGELQKGTDNDNSLVGKFLDPVASSKLVFTPTPGSFPIGKTETTSLTYVDFLKLIDEQIRASNGNYDAMFGKVCNFHWSFMQDGSYDITIDLVSIGDIIESFKINALTSGIDTSIKVEKKEGEDKKDPSQMTSEELIDDYVNQSEIGKKFYQLIHNLEEKVDIKDIIEQKKEREESRKGLISLPEADLSVG